MLKYLTSRSALSASVPLSEAPKPKTQAASKPESKSNPDDEFGDLPWEKKAEPAKAKDDVASAFDDLFNS